MLLACVQPRGEHELLEQLSVGNVELRILGRREHAVGGRVNGAVGIVHRRVRRTTPPESIAVVAGDAVLAFTDGIPARAALAQAAHHQPALIIAEQLFAQRRGDDDALVFVAK